jgi:hypothetical protein
MAFNSIRDKVNETDGEASSGVPLILFSKDFTLNMNVHDALSQGMGDDWQFKDLLKATVEDRISSDNNIQSMKDTCSMTIDECAAITYYTCDVRQYGGTREECPYRRINSLLITRKVDELWKPFLHILLSALNKLPMTKTRVYRYLDKPITALSKQYKKDCQICWIGFTSTSLSKETMKGFIDKNKQGTFMAIDVIEGKNISCFSLFPNEAELLLLPNSLFIVDDVLSDKMKDVFNIPDGIVLTQKPTPSHLLLMKLQDSSDSQLKKQESTSNQKPPISIPQIPIWKWKDPDSGNFNAYDPNTNAIIERACNTGGLPVKVKIGNADWTIDFRSKKTNS